MVKLAKDFKINLGREGESTKNPYLFSFGPSARYYGKYDLNKVTLMEPTVISYYLFREIF